MKLISHTNFYITIKSTILSVLLILSPAISSASLVYKIDAQQIFDTDTTPVSGYVVWDELLSTITSWHFETVPGYGVHDIPTEGAIFDDGGLSDSMIAGVTLTGESVQTFYTIIPTAKQELEIIWGTPPDDAAAVNSWAIKETWVLNDFGGVHWRLGTVSVSLVAEVPVPPEVSGMWNGANPQFLLIFGKNFGTSPRVTVNGVSVLATGDDTLVISLLSPGITPPFTVKVTTPDGSDSFPKACPGI